MITKFIIGMMMVGVLARAESQPTKNRSFVQLQAHPSSDLTLKSVESGKKLNTEIKPGQLKPENLDKLGKGTEGVGGGSFVVIDGQTLLADPFYAGVPALKISAITPLRYSDFPKEVRQYIWQLLKFAYDVTKPADYFGVDDFFADDRQTPDINLTKPFYVLSRALSGDDREVYMMVPPSEQDHIPCQKYVPILNRPVDAEYQFGCTFHETTYLFSDKWNGSNASVAELAKALIHERMWSMNFDQKTISYFTTLLEKLYQNSTHNGPAPTQEQINSLKNVLVSQKDDQNFKKIKAFPDDLLNPLSPPTIAGVSDALGRGWKPPMFHEIKFTVLTQSYKEVSVRPFTEKECNITPVPIEVEPMPIDGTCMMPPEVSKSYCAFLGGKLPTVYEIAVMRSAVDSLTSAQRAAWDGPFFSTGVAPNTYRLYKPEFEGAFGEQTCGPGDNKCGDVRITWPIPAYAICVLPKK